MTEQKHTELPWKVGNSGYQDTVYSARYDVRDQDILGRFEFNSDAAFAVKAVNNHKKLVDLVKRLIENDPNDSAADAVTVLDVWRKDAKNLLNKLESN